MTTPRVRLVESSVGSNPFETSETVPRKRAEDPKSGSNMRRSSERPFLSGHACLADEVRRICTFLCRAWIAKHSGFLCIPRRSLPGVHSVQQMAKKPTCFRSTNCGCDRRRFHSSKETQGRKLCRQPANIHRFGATLPASPVYEKWMSADVFRQTLPSGDPATDSTCIQT